MENVNEKLGQIPYPFSKSPTFGVRDENPTVEFVNERAGIRKTIVNEKGCFVNFPGIEKGKWMGVLGSEKCLDPVIHYRTSFERKGPNLFMVIWEVQPDGMYWMDEDGFGMEDDLEVRLYTFIDENGDFLGPFRIYNVGMKKYYNLETDAGV